MFGYALLPLNHVFVHHKFAGSS